MNTQAQINQSKQHSLSMSAREQLEIKGVIDVVSFDEQSVSLDTVCGSMTVEGDSLHIRVLNLDQGLVSISGRVDAIEYFDTANKTSETRGWLGRIFR